MTIENAVLEVVVDLAGIVASVREGTAVVRWEIPKTVPEHSNRNFVVALDVEEETLLLHHRMFAMLVPE